MHEMSHSRANQFYVNLTSIKVYFYTVWRLNLSTCESCIYLVDGEAIQQLIKDTVHTVTRNTDVWRPQRHQSFRQTSE